MKIDEIKGCFITGATSGIGKALAIELGKRGVPLFLTGRNQEELNALKATTGADVFAADLSNPTSLGELLRWVDEKDPNLQIHNAGFGVQGPYESLTDQEVVDMVQVNCLTLALQTKKAIDRWKRRGEKGMIVNVSSILGHIPFSFSALYAATKAFVRSLSLSVEGELLESGVRVLTSCPGPVVTDFQRRAGRGNGKNNQMKGMAVEEAVDAIISQIESEKREVLFSRKYALLVWLSKNLLPFRLNTFIAKRAYQDMNKAP